MMRSTTKKTVTSGTIYLRIKQRRKDWGGYKYWERFLEEFKGYVRGNDEVDFDDLGDYHPPNHQYFITLTAAVTGIIVSCDDIATTNGQPHRTGLLHHCILTTAPN